MLGRRTQKHALKRHYTPCTFATYTYMQNNDYFCQSILFDNMCNKMYCKDSCVSRTFLLKFWDKNRGCGLYMRPLLSEGVNWLLGVTN